MTDRETRAERQERLQARLAEEAAGAARLPAAVCGACGGVVAAGTGTIAEWGPWADAREVREFADVDADRTSRRLPPIMAWHRRHDECVDPADVVRTITGDAVSARVAALALGSASPGLYVSHRSPDALTAAQMPGERHPRPWGHLRDEEVAGLRLAVQKARAKVEPTRCTQGACGWCGVATAMGWRSSPESWADGSPAPLCIDCALTWDSRGAPVPLEDRRRAALEALSDVGMWGGDGLGIKTFCDVAGAAHSGTPGRWEYAPAPLADLRERARLGWWPTLPAHLRDEYGARAAQRDADAMRTARTEREAEAVTQAARDREEARLAGWPV